MIRTDHYPEGYTIESWENIPDEIKLWIADQIMADDWKETGHRLRMLHFYGHGVGLYAGVIVDGEDVKAIIPVLFVRDGTISSALDEDISGVVIEEFIVPALKREMEN